MKNWNSFYTKPVQGRGAQGKVCTFHSRCKETAGQAAHRSVKCWKFMWCPFRLLALNPADSPRPLPSSSFYACSMPASKFQSKLPKTNHHNSCLYPQPKETDFFIWNLILDYSIQLRQELPPPCQREESYAWHNTELGGTYRKEKQWVTLAALLVTCLVQPSSKGQIKKSPLIKKKKKVLLVIRYFAIYRQGTVSII